MNPALIATLSIIGSTMDIIGKIIIAYTAIQVHVRVKEEHRIDKAVFDTMEREKKLSYIGVFLMVAGYLLQLPAKTHLI